MADNLAIATSAKKEDRYEILLPQIESLILGEPDLIANLSNIAAALKQTFNFFWVGFYLVKEDSGKEELVLGPFQGPIACTRIGFGKGVCGASWKEEKTIIVPNVDEYPGHIACSSDSKSEIVLPAFKEGKVFLVLDIDSDRLNDFDGTDAAQLEQLMRIIERTI
jgi:L-methionine (R)-S-oxide reductase